MLLWVGFNEILILNKLSSWFKYNKLTLNLDKTCYSIFTRLNHTGNYQISIGDKAIQNVPTAKYLGMNLDDDLSWKTHIESTSKKLRRFLSPMYYLSQFLTNDSQALTIYYSYIFPHIRYGIELYGLPNKSLL